MTKDYEGKPRSGAAACETCRYYDVCVCWYVDSHDEVLKL